MFTVKSAYGRGWRVLNPQGVDACDRFDYREDAQRYADLRNQKWDHARAWNEVYREGKGGQQAK